MNNSIFNIIIRRMLINLKTCAYSSDAQTISISIQERLPDNVSEASHMTCKYTVKDEQTYHLLVLDVRAELTMLCQRCLHTYKFDYIHQTVLAVCATDELADRLMSSYDTITVEKQEVDLLMVLTDDLHLNTPLNHPNREDCDKITMNFISSSLKS